MAGSRSAPIETPLLGPFLFQIQCVGVDRWGYDSKPIHRFDCVLFLARTWQGENVPL